MQINAIFHRKEPQFETQACVVEKIIELPPDEYEAFRGNMLKDRQFIAEFSQAMRAQGKGSDHCLLVLGEEHEDGILVNTEGYGYARYAAFIPGARRLLLIEEMQEEQTFSNQVRQIKGVDPSNIPAWLEHIRELAETNTNAYGPDVHVEYLRLLRDFGSAFRRIDQKFAETPAEIFNYKPGYQPEELLPAADWISNGGAADEAHEIAQNGWFQPRHYAADRIMENWGLLGDGEDICYTFAEMQESYGFEGGPIPLLVDELRGREGLANVYVNEESGEFTVRFKPFDQAQAALNSLTQEDLEVIHARHMLWLHAQPGGEQADFSGQKLSELNLFHLRFSRANFAGAVIMDCCMDEGNFFNCDFLGAELRCNSVCDAEFVGARFDGATIADCNFKDGWCMSACFSGAQISGCDFTDVDLDDADFSQAEITACTGLDDIVQGPAQIM